MLRPPHIRNFGDKIQRQWMYVFDSVLKKTGDKKRAIMAGNSVLKKRFTRKNAMEKNDAHDFFNMKVEDWLGNLQS